MKYWINRRARELSLRFMYSLDVRYSDEPINPIDFRSNILSFWSTNPINNYYMLKKLRIKKNNMIVIGCSTLKNNRIFLRIIDSDKFNKIILPLENKDKFKSFLRNYNLNEKTDYNDSDFYKILRDLFANSKKIVTRNIIKNKATEIISGCVKNIKPIDDEIDQSIKNWRFDRINSVDLNILRIAVYEILFSRGIPVPVSIKEAIVLALKYSSDESCSFINGILDSISKRALQ
ncbi:MAG: transcription antitermination factor NusB [Thermodesulfobacteriota bacterium]|nr:transcription antitermination factor NusB [Thermodesulfobacteriota bacterium]MEE2975388.1 transcription antitermination factor NusB [Thermodesulfobacteriota bacterium]|tara:strand:+ start:355 stop:1053 length:699 start_codon:yes stop_codon:yes gene_type:complete